MKKPIKKIGNKAENRVDSVKRGNPKHSNFFEDKHQKKEALKERIEFLEREISFLKDNLNFGEKARRQLEFSLADKERDMEELHNIINEFQIWNNAAKERIDNFESSLLFKFFKKMDDVIDIFPDKFSKKYHQLVISLRNLVLTIGNKHGSVNSDKRGKRILFINHEESRTGAPKVLFDIAKFLKKDYEIVIASLKKGSMSEDFKREFSKIVYPGSSRIFEFRKRYARHTLLEQKPDLVYVNSIVSHAFALEAKKLGIPVIFHVHELDLGFQTSLHGVDCKNFNDWADVFIAVSEKVRDYLINKMHCRPEKVALFNAFISSKEINGLAKQDNLIDIKRGTLEKRSTFLVMSIGSVCFRKGTDLFIEAGRIVEDKGYKDIKFLWIGSLSHRYQINDFFNRESHNCIFIGECKNPYPILKIADIFLLSSREDPFPLVALEAMTLKKPVIAIRNTGGMAKVIEDYHCGIVVDEINPEKLAEAIIKLYKDSKLRKFYGKNGFLTQCSKYDSTIILKKIKNLTEKIFEDNKNPGNKF